MNTNSLANMDIGLEQSLEPINLNSVHEDNIKGDEEPGGPVFGERMTVIDSIPPQQQAGNSSLKAFKKGITKPIRSIHKKLRGKKKDKNAVHEISLQPEDETPKECWVTGSSFPEDDNSAEERGLASAGSRKSRMTLEEDSIEVIYDADYHGKL